MHCGGNRGRCRRRCPPLFPGAYADALTQQRLIRRVGGQFVDGLGMLAHLVRLRAVGIQRDYDNREGDGNTAGWPMPSFSAMRAAMLLTMALWLLGRPP